VILYTITRAPYSIAIAEFDYIAEVTAAAPTPSWSSFSALGRRGRRWLAAANKNNSCYFIHPSSIQHGPSSNAAGNFMIESDPDQDSPAEVIVASNSLVSSQDVQILGEIRERTSINCVPSP
jgi:hypothetical protein